MATYKIRLTLEFTPERLETILVKNCDVSTQTRGCDSLINGGSCDAMYINPII